jgi:hypothetical protein
MRSPAVRIFCLGSQRIYKGSNPFPTSSSPNGKWRNPKYGQMNNFLEPYFAKIVCSSRVLYSGYNLHKPAFVQI